MSLLEKIQVIESLPGCGWSIRAEARIASGACKVELARHQQELRDIEERFVFEAWRHVEKCWTPEEREVVRRAYLDGRQDL